MSKTLTKIDERELHAIAKAINDREGTIQECKRRTFSEVNSALTEAILQGQDLIKAKSRIPHGLFMEWLKVNCPNVEYRMASNYMRMASNMQRVAHLGEADSIRTALLLCDEVEGKSEDKAQPKQWLPYLEGLYRIGKLVGFFKDNPPSAWPEEGKEKARTDLLPMASALWPDKFTAP